MIIVECDGGCGNVTTTTLNSVNGMGNAQPAQMAAMTGAEQTDPNSLGSGDVFGKSNIKKRKKYYIAKRKKDGTIIKVKENLTFSEAMHDDILNDTSEEYKIYLMI